MPKRAKGASKRGTAKTASHSKRSRKVRLGRLQGAFEGRSGIAIAVVCVATMLALMVFGDSDRSPQLPEADSTWQAWALSGEYDVSYAAAFSQNSGVVAAGQVRFDNTGDLPWSCNSAIEWTAGDIGARAQYSADDINAFLDVNGQRFENTADGFTVIGDLPVLMSVPLGALLPAGPTGFSDASLCAVISKLPLLTAAPVELSNAAALSTELDATVADGFDDFVVTRFDPQRLDELDEWIAAQGTIARTWDELFTETVEATRIEFARRGSSIEISVRLVSGDVAGGLLERITLTPAT